MLRINLSIEKAAANKHSDIFFRIIHNIYMIKLTLRYFHILVFPIKCIKRGAAERSTIN